MIYRPTPQLITEYSMRDSINQSSIVEILNNGIQSFLEKQEALRAEEEGLIPEKDPAHFLVGKGVDVTITGYIGQFQVTFHSSKLIKKPGDGAVAALKLAFQMVKQDHLDEINDEDSPVRISTDPTIYVETLNEACVQAGYYADPKYNNSRVNTLLKPGSGAAEYWQDMVEADGKKILSGEEENKVKNVTFSLLNHPHTAHWFKDGDTEDDIDIVFQFPCYWEYLDIHCKALIDMLVINHTRETITVFDIKTTGDHVLLFNRAMRKRRYDIQGSFYSEGLRNNLTQLATLINKHLIGYTIMDFAFMVESTKSTGCPMIYPMDKDLIEIGRRGDGRYGTELGWEQGLHIFNEWRQTGFSLERRFQSTNGIVKIGAGFTYNENF
jgi:hypothetical protein